METAGRIFWFLGTGRGERVMGGSRSGPQGFSERRGEEETQRDANRTEEGREREKERTRERGEQQGCKREHQDTGAVCFQLCLG